MWIRSWQRLCRLMPSRAASVQIKIRSGSVAGSEFEAALQLLAPIGGGGAGEASDPIIWVDLVQSFGELCVRANGACPRTR